MENTMKFADYVAAGYLAEGDVKVGKVTVFRTWIIARIEETCKVLGDSRNGWKSLPHSRTKEQWDSEVEHWVYMGAAEVRGK